MLEQLVEIWESLESPANADSLGRRAPQIPPGRSAYLAVDRANRRQLAVRISDDDEGFDDRETRGLLVTTERLSIANSEVSDFVVFTCNDAGHNQTFALFANDLLSTLRSADDSAATIAVRTLARWRSFWQRNTLGLSQNDATGLFGELWFLTHWLNACSYSDIEKWMPVQNGRHDFQWIETSVEVKTGVTSSVNGPIHEISSLDQLDDPVDGRLYLFSLQVVEDSIANNSLNAVVDELISRLRVAPDALRLFEDKLASRGYSSATRSVCDRRFRLVAELLFRVDGDFPRILRSSFTDGIPSGIEDVKYRLHIASCREWLLASSPSSIESTFLRD